MKNIGKYLIISILDLVLIIPILFGVFTQFLILAEINLPTILLGLLFFFIFIFLGKWIELFGFDVTSLELMRKHDATASILEKNNRAILYFFFPLTILMEELIFRYYSIGLLLNFLSLDFIFIVLISSLIFSLYHLHFWFRFKNARITIVYIVSSFFLGLYLSFILITLGVIFCVIVHYLITLFLYNSLAKKISKRLKKNIN